METRSEESFLEHQPYQLLPLSGATASTVLPSKMKNYLWIYFAFILILANLNFLQVFQLSSHLFDNPADDRSYSAVLDLSEGGEVENTTITIVHVKNRSDITSDDAGMHSLPTMSTTPQNKTIPKDLLKTMSTLKVSMLPGNLSNSTIYHCGYKDARDIYEHIYPEYNGGIRNAVTLNRRTVLGSTKNDVLLVGFGGHCGAYPKLTTYYFEHYFKGTVIQINRENFTDGIAWQDPKNSSTIPKNQYHLGYVESGCQSLRIFYMAQFLLLQKELWDFIFQIEKKPVSSRERFLIYTAGNCVDFRQSAFDAIALANPSLTVEHAAGCHGNMNLTNVVKYNPHTGREFNKNWKFMREFRFCLVMENSYVDGYITEKILLAFAAGCIP